MSTIMKISRQGQIRIPKKILQTLDIEKGDYVEVELEEGHIILKPRKLIDPSQAQGWYWTKEWQKMEADVDEDIEKHQVSPKFRTAKEGIKWLKK